MVIICLIGDLQDFTCVYFGWLAKRRNVTLLQLSEESLGCDWTFSFNDRRCIEGTLSIKDSFYTFDNLCGCFVRLNPNPPLPPNLQLPAMWEQVFITERRVGLQYFLDHLPCPVANRPTSGRSNGSKPFQMNLLADVGFDIPRWIVTNEETTLNDFVNTCEYSAIYKSCSGLRSKVSFVDTKLLATISQGTSPILIQEYIPGREVRIHTVGDKYFPTEVIGEGVDYRQQAGRKYFPTSAPDEITKMCCEFAASEGLLIAGFDFRIAENGKWYCLEMNPVPTFLPYEMSTGQPIGDTLLDIMIKN